jgi:uncharacterized phage infection (PIP) family protein YhgE
VSEKIKPMLLIGKILVILALPILFFSYIGQNPMKKTETASREIAIVNEDNALLQNPFVAQSLLLH